MNNKKTIISEGRRPLTHIIIATLCFTIAILLLAMFFFDYDIFPNDNHTHKNNLNLDQLFFIKAMGIFFSKVKNVHFNLEEKKYKEEYCIGPIKLGRWKNLPKIEYVSVFKQLKENDSYAYKTNLWYNRNKHYTIYENLDEDASLAMGEAIAKTLDVDLLDATEPHNQKWMKL